MTESRIYGAITAIHTSANGLTRANRKIILLGATFTYVTGRTYDSMCSEWQFICNLGGTAGLSLVPKGQEFFVYYRKNS